VVLVEVPKSFVTLDPLSKKERRVILREHQGVCPIDRWPNKLVLKQSTKQSKDMQNAKKLTLVERSGEASKFLERNDHSTKMAGTTWSRSLDVRADLSTNLENDPGAWCRADDVLHQLEEVVQCAEGTFRFSLDCALAVRHRKKGGVMLQLGSFDPPWRAEHKLLSVVFHFKIFFGEKLNPKVHDLDVY
jgi:hypothetical protein